MRFKIIFAFVLVTLLFSCKKAEQPVTYEVPTPTFAPVSRQNQGIVVDESNVAVAGMRQVFTVDGQFLGTEKTLTDMLKEKALRKIRELSPKESEFVCDCFIKEIRKTNDSDSIFLVSINACDAILKQQRKAQPDFYFYTKNGDFVGTKPTVKAKIKNELKEAKVTISNVLLNDVVDCIGKRYRSMTTKEIKNNQNLVLECLIDNSSKTTK